MTAATGHPAAYGNELRLTTYLEQSYPPPRATQGGGAAALALARATALVSTVREEGPDTTAAVLDPLDRAQLYALVTVLAAMVPDDRPVLDLLGWVLPLGVELEEQAERDRAYQRYHAEKAKREAAA